MKQKTNEDLGVKTEIQNQPESEHSHCNMYFFSKHLFHFQWDNLNTTLDPREFTHRIWQAPSFSFK